MKIATRKSLIFKDALREYKASTQLTKTDKAQLQGQIKDIWTKIEVAMHKNQKPQQKSTRVMQHIIEEMKAVYELIQKDLDHEKCMRNNSQN